MHVFVDRSLVHEAFFCCGIEGDSLNAGNEINFTQLCVCTCMYVHTYIYTCMYIYKSLMHEAIFACRDALIASNEIAFTQSCAYIFIQIYIYLYISICMYVYV